MNKTETITYQKILMPLRLPPETYRKMMDKVYAQKAKNRGYSANQLITALIEKDLGIKRR